MPPQDTHHFLDALVMKPLIHRSRAIGQGLDPGPAHSMSQDRIVRRYADSHGIK